MVQRMALKTAERMSEHRIINAKEIRIYAYGLELLFSSSAGVAALMVISAVCRKPFLWIPYLAGFVPLRLSGGGYHTKTHFQCIFTFSLIFFLIVLLEKYYTISMKIWLATGFVNLAIILLFSPVAAPNKPLRKKQGRTNRRNSIVLSFINLLGCAILFSFFVSNSRWLNMYFAGSSMAGMSMLLAVIKTSRRGGKSMKTMISQAMVKLGSLLASAALFFALSNVSSTCGFMLYQPDVPEELM